MSVIFVLSSTAQKIVRYPMFDNSQTPEFKIDSVVNNAKETILYFHYDNREGTTEWINISPETYIKDDNGKIYPVLALENIAKGPERTQILGKKEWNCIVHFPHIDSKYIDFIENENKISFNIYGIDLTKDGDFSGYADFAEINRKLIMADFYFIAKNYKKYIEIATPLLSQVRSSLGRDGVANIIQNLIDSHVLSANKNADYDKYIVEFRELCEKHGWQKGLNCSLTLSLELLDYSNAIFQLNAENKLEEACSLMSEYLPKAELVYESNDTTIAFKQGMYAMMLKKLGRYDSAIEWGQKAIDNYAKLNNIGGVYQTTLLEMAIMCDEINDIERADKFYQSLYELQEKSGNKYSFKHAQTGYLWGCLFKDNNQRGLTCLENAYMLYDSSKMTIDSLYIHITKAISNNYTEQGNDPQSIEVWEHAMQNIKNRIGTNNAHYFNAIVELAEKCRLTGNIGKASENIYELSKEMTLQTFTLEHIKELNIFANILFDMGNSAEALNVLKKTSDIYKRYNLTHERNYAYLLLDIAWAYQKNSDTINCINTCKNIIEESFESEITTNESNDIKLYAKNILAQIYQDTNPAYSAEITKDVILFEDNHNLFINDPKEQAINHLNYLYTLHKNDSTVQRIYEELKTNNNHESLDTKTKTILDFATFMKETIGKNNFDYDNIQKYKGLIHTDVIRNMFEDFKETVLSNFQFLTEEQREIYYNESVYTFFNPIQLAIAGDIARDEELIGTVYDYLLLTKSILLTSSTQLSNIVYNSDDKELIESYEKFQELYNEFDKETIESYEHSIIQKVRKLSNYTSILQIHWQTIKDALEDNEVALEFITNNDGPKGYGVLILRKSLEYPQYVDFALVEKAIEEYGFERMSNIWTILMNKGFIKAGDTVFMSSAGVFQTKYLEHLEVSSGIYFSDVCNVIRVTSTREIVKQRNHRISMDNSLVLFGGLDYDNAEVGFTDKPATNTSIFRGEGDERYRAGFENLKYSQKEIEVIRGIANSKNFKCREYSGKNGTELHVKNLSGENIGVLHFATHGLYYPKSNPNVANDNPFKQLFNNNDCLNRSFLVMSGGNALPQHKQVANSNSDGLLTAAEISHIDLHNVNLVVLSACQSAKGDISNEGVLGLQYGFKKAGVKSILMCLDNVDDHATQIFMEEFYKHLLTGLSKRESLKKAQHLMRTNPLEKYHNPEYWANYILLDAID